MADARAIRIDGAVGEGGGQVVRTALFLSVLHGRPVHIINVRAGRKRPGLRPQHTATLEALCRMTDGEATGGQVGSQDVVFRPGPPRQGTWRVDVGTAGSITLVLQTLLPVAMVTPGPTRLRITGGTDVPFSPSLAWWQHVYLPTIAPLADSVAVDVVRRGFYPAGGGRVDIDVVSSWSEEPDLDAVRGHVADRLGSPRTVQAAATTIAGLSVAHTSLARASVAERQKKAARAPFVERGLPTPRIKTDYVEADGPGTSMAVWIVAGDGSRLGGDAIGAPGRRAEDVGEAAAATLLEDWSAGATVDRHLADHWAPWVALGAGAVRVPRPTLHLRTNMEVCNAMLEGPRLALDGPVLGSRPA
jgi:RNA 3'-phosphate cyclase